MALKSKRRLLGRRAGVGSLCVGVIGLVLVSCQLASARPIAPTFSLLTDGISVQTGTGPLALGPDGAVWSALAGGLGRFDARGVVHPAPIRATSSFRPYLVSAHDGSLWVVSPGERSTVTRITRDGTSTSVPLDGLIGGATLGPDGALWVTATGQFASDPGLRVDRVATDGSQRPFAVPGFGDLGPIATGADGNLWFATNTYAGQSKAVTISRLSPAGQLSSWAVGAVVPVAPAQSIEAVGGVAAGPGGIWFTLADDRIGRIGYDGAVSLFAERTHDGPPPMALTQGPDGAMWFTQFGTLSQLGTPALGRVDSHGHISQYPWRGLAALAGPATPPQQLGANSIVTGPDQTLWFSIPGLNAVGRFSPRGNCSVPSLIGRGLAQAKHLLTTAGCRPRLPQKQHGTVISAQSKPAGTLLRPGAPVAITTTSRRAAAKRCLAAPGQRPLLADAHFRLVATLQTDGLDSSITYFLCRMHGTGIHPSRQIPDSVDGDGYTSTTSLFTLTGRFLAWETYSADKYFQQGGSIEVLGLATSALKTYGLARTSGGELINAATSIALDASGNVAWLQPGEPQVGPRPNPDIVAAGLANSTVTILDTGPPGSLGAPAFTTGDRLEWTHDGHPQTYRYP